MVEMNFSATSHTLRALASAGIVTATAAAVFGAALLAPAAALADEPEPIVSAVEKEDAARNFAVNLPEGTNAATLDESARIAEQLGAVVLSKYPAFATMFVQAKSKSFAQDYANVLKTAGITLNSIGPTRTAVVTGTEDVVDKDAARSSQAPTELQKNSQFYDETQLQDDNDPYTTIDKAWGILALEADKARQVTDSSVKLEPVTVGVVDSGIDYKHFKDTDFKDRIDTADSVSCATNGIPDQSSEDVWQPTTSSHGTHVAGTIAAAHNGSGVDGVAPQNEVKLASVKVVNDPGYIYPEYAVCGMVWSADHHFDVTNNSYYVDPWEYWLPNDPSQAAGYEAVRRSVAYATKSGVTVVAAAGNSDQDLDNPTTDSGSPDDNGDANKIPNRDVRGGKNIPTTLPNVVTVSAAGEAKNVSEIGKGESPAIFPLKRASFSNYGKNSIDVTAPGLYIASTVDPDIDGNKYYAYYSGTSMASPHVAGVAALIKGIHPDYTPTQVLDLLRKQASENDFDTKLSAPNAADGNKEWRGIGLVNALSAVTKDQPKPTVGELQYSIDDGATWNVLNGATVSGKGKVRSTVTGPVTKATLTVGKDSATKTSDGSFNGSVTVETEVDFDALAKEGTSVNATLNADGRNNYPTADDDVSTTAGFTVKASASKPSTAAPVKPGNGSNTSSNAQADDGDKDIYNSAQSADGKLGSTGVDVIAIAAATTLLLVFGGILLLRRHRA